MPRITRLVIEGFPHHVVHRGNNRQEVFLDDSDRKNYLSLVRLYSFKHNCKVLAYCLMDNHIHLMLIPEIQTSLAKMMQGVSLCFTQKTNRKYSRTGSLWESHFFSCPIDKDNYLLNSLRYIESNPVRSGQVEHAVDYPWSSAQSHVNNQKDLILSEPSWFREILASVQYNVYLEAQMKVVEILCIRESTYRGMPLGNSEFLKRIGVIEKENQIVSRKVNYLRRYK